MQGLVVDAKNAVWRSHSECAREAEGALWGRIIIIRPGRCCPRLLVSSSAAVASVEPAHEWVLVPKAANWLIVVQCHCGSGEPRAFAAGCRPKKSKASRSASL